MQNDDIELINEYTRKELKQEDVYIFTVTLCDNDIDRDFERFTKEALEGLCELFKGKTGIFDHNMKSEGQNARIFKTWTEAVPGKLTSDGEDYYCLKAKAYMVRTESNKALIEEIEGGIKKEVSVGCAMGKIACSICGSDMKANSCCHIKGKNYDGKLCSGILSEPYDAYEWSFVAVPSQRQAGVTKSFAANENEQDALKTIKNAQDTVMLSKAQTKRLSDYIKSLEKSKDEAQQFRKMLLQEIKKYALLTMPYVSTESFLNSAYSMSAKELCTLRDGLKKQVCENEVPLVQLAGTSNKKENNNDSFRI